MWCGQHEEAAQARSYRHREHASSRQRTRAALELAKKVTTKDEVVWLIRDFRLVRAGSMSCGQTAGMSGITPRVDSAAMATMWHAQIEACHIVGFSHELVPVTIGPQQKLNGVISTLEKVPMGGTDCAQPMLYTMKQKLKVDALVMYTDSETWFGSVHPRPLS